MLTALPIRPVRGLSRVLTIMRSQDAYLGSKQCRGLRGTTSTYNINKVGGGTVSKTGSSSNWRATMDKGSFLVDYAVNKHFDVYAGVASLTERRSSQRLPADRERELHERPPDYSFKTSAPFRAKNVLQVALSVAVFFWGGGGSACVAGPSRKWDSSELSHPSTSSG